MRRLITRRDFMRESSVVALGAMIGCSKGEGVSASKTRVVLVRYKNVWEGDALNPAIVQQMLDEAVMALLGYDDPVRAFQLLAKPGDIVGVKSNAWRFLPTPRELENAIEKRLLDAGVKKENISIDDRGVRYNPVFQNATALINVRPLRTHHWSGIGGCLKNYIIFMPRPSDYHGDSCADLAAFWQSPVGLREKTRLNILSVLNPQFHGRGPHHFDTRYVWKYHGILVSQDPVAVDAVGLEIINAKRLEYFGRERALPTSPKHIMMADQRHRLGTSDLAKIELVKLGWKDGILI